MNERAVAGAEIEALIALLAKLPGLGPRSARRAVLHIIKKREVLLEPLSAALSRLAEAVCVCHICHAVDCIDPCTICRDPKRDSGTLLVVEDMADLWALERAAALNCRYHVLGGVLSPLDGIGPDDLTIDSLAHRVGSGGINEIVLATNATMDGRTTAHYITDRLREFNVRMTVLAHGIPVGGELDYMDDGTLSEAIRARSDIKG